MKTFVFLFGLLSALSGFSQHVNDSLILILKKEIKQKEVHVQRKQQVIDKLTKEQSAYKQLSVTAQFDLYNRLYHQYKVFIYDSASKYANKLIETAYKLDDKNRIGYARVKFSFILLSAGMFKEALDSLQVIELKYLPDSVKANYYWLLGKTYADLNNYNKDKSYSDAYITLNQKYLDSALVWCKNDSYQHDYYLIVKSGQLSNYGKVIDVAERLLKTHKLSEAQQAVVYFDLGNAYRGLNQLDKTIECTIKSSLCDVRAATKETAAMYTLAKLLYERGDQENAYTFIRQALDDAQFYGAHQRMVEIGSILPVIASRQLNNSEIKRKIWFSYAFGLTLVVIIICCFSFVIFRQFKKLKTAEARIMHANDTLQNTILKLKEANTIKEEFIGYYFSVNSEYLEKIEAFKRSVEQKLNKKKYDDIMFMMNNMNMKKEREELHASFDKVFLKLFPDFIKTFNSYMKDGEQVVVKEGQYLNTELRIFALFRMGITDAEHIARILNYSVNTIYTYKTRIRTRSFLENDEFDKRIMEINAG
jgi:tetratricopeptide (TPR) repeat protein